MHGLRSASAIFGRQPSEHVAQGGEVALRRAPLRQLGALPAGHELGKCEQLPICPPCHNGQSITPRPCFGQPSDGVGRDLVRVRKVAVEDIKRETPEEGAEWERQRTLEWRVREHWEAQCEPD